MGEAPRASDLRSFARSRPGAALILVLGLVYAASQAAILAILAPLGVRRVLAAQVSVLPEGLERIFGEWVREGLLGRYRFHFALDLPHPLWYGACLLLLIARFMPFDTAPAEYRVAVRAPRALLALPLAAAILDTAENAAHLAFLADAALIRQPWVALSGAASILKWILSTASLAIIASFAFAAPLARARIEAGRRRP